MRKGSALLIVLGMLSFMVVSAVGFSMFMRQSRLPSSYLRRNVSARYLVKAALANAIEELDGGFMSLYDIGEEDGTKDEHYEWGRFFGVYDDPYPGCGPDSGESDLKSGQREVNNEKMRFCKNGDLWVKRVFCPFGPLDTPRTEPEALNRLPQTVPTMTLEALAYLPPAIIDDVRLMSRKTRTAQWRMLPYEAGRYAYTAVNVSDLFDINRLRASEPRDSGANRITLASLGAKSADQPFSFDQTRLEALDDLLDKVYDKKVNGRVVPFVSLADFSLFAAGTPFSPFTQYIGGSASSILPNDPAVANAMFITDSWFPKSLSASGSLATLDLAECQPFKNYNANDLLSIIMSQNDAECRYVVNGSEQTVKASAIYEKNLGPSTIALYDYLDGNRQPSSLAFPTTEAVPMIVAVGAPGKVSPEIEAVENGSKSAQRTIGNYQYNVERKLTKYVLKSFGNQIVVQAAAMYPFRRMAKTVRNGNYQLRGVLRFYLSPKTEFMGRPSRPMGLALRAGLKDAFANENAKSYSAGVASFSCAQQMVQFTSDNASQKEYQNWIKDVTLTFNTDGIDIPIIQHVEETWTPLKNDPDNPTPPVTKKPVDTFMGMGVNSDQALLSYVADSGAPIEDGQWAKLSSQQLSADITEPGTTDGAEIDGVTAAKDDRKDLQLYAAVWLQVVEGSGAGAKVYDMVPACGEDDELFLDAQVPPGLTCGEYCPLLNFRCAYNDMEINADLGKTLTGEATWFDDRNALFVADPRYNHSPENWFFKSYSNVGLADQWYETLDVGNEQDDADKVFGTDGRDRDVFMFVSDQEYLQSVGEFQFLPALRNLDGTGKMIDDSAYAAGNGCDGRAYHKVDDKLMSGDLANGGTAGPFPDGDLFWRTYTAYNNGTGGYDENIYKLPCNGMNFRLVPGADSFKVNPYTDDSRILSAVMAGTPFDYYVASTNDDQRQDGAKKNDIRDRITTQEEMEDYSFCENCELAKITNDEMSELQNAIWTELSKRASKGITDWDEAWNSLSWQSVQPGNCGDNNKIFLGDVILGSPLYGVDRKYLFSFWRECFDNRQQLFLIFVRAEPATIGGGAAGNVSSAQLGGRAVALVWRDPGSPGNRKERPKQSDSDGKIRMSDFRRDYKCEHPPHRTRVLFYHQFD